MKNKLILAALVPVLLSSCRKPSPSTAILSIGRWSEPIVIAEGPDASLAVPRLAINAYGTVQLAWLKTTKGISTVHARRKPFGAEWEKTQSVFKGTTKNIFLTSLPINKDFILSFEEKNRAMVSSYHPPAGWGPPTAIASESHAYERPVLRMGGDRRLYAVWACKQSVEKGGGNRQCMTSTDGKSPWGRLVQVEGAPSRVLDMISPDGLPPWSFSTSFQGPLIAMQLLPDLVPVKAVGMSPKFVQTPVVSRSPSGKVGTIVWEQLPMKGQEAGIMVSRISSDGRRTKPRLLARPNAWGPAVAANDSGMGAAGWIAHVRDWKAAHARITTAAGWGDAEWIDSRTGGESHSLEMAVDEKGNTLAVWGHRSGSEPESLLFGNLNLKGSGWNEAGLVGAEGDTTTSPAAVVSLPGGGFLIAWVDYIKGNWRLLSREWTPKIAT